MDNPAQDRQPVPSWKPEPGRLVVASHNAGKVAEIGALVSRYGMEPVSVASFGLPVPDETGETFAENACIKAQAAAQATGLPALADDSGLEVAALDGAPGIYSARWGGDPPDFSRAIGKIEQALKESRATDLSARFVCALCLFRPDGTRAVFEGRVSGHLVFPPRGTKGFGYDPVFVPDGHDMTFAEMDPDAKHAISHRADAFRKLRAACLEDR